LTAESFLGYDFIRIENIPMRSRRGSGWKT
jgi:hypothetical protein